MATNLAIDPALIEQALKVSGERTKKAAVTKALEEFVARRQQKRVLDLMGALDRDSSTTTRRSVRAIEPVRGYPRLVARIPARCAFLGGGSTDAGPVVRERRDGNDGPRSSGTPAGLQPCIRHD